MPRTVRVACGIIMFYFLLITQVNADDQWHLSKKTDGIWVYTRPSPTCGFDEFKGITIIDSGIEVLGMVLKDIPSFPLWMSDCQKSPIIEQNGRNDYIFYFVQKVPWPVKNRDMVLQARTTIDWKAGYFQVDFHSVDDARIPLSDEYIRMKVVGRFLLEYIDRDKTQVTYTIKADPGGYMPAVIANIISRKIPFETLCGMREIVKNSRYRNRTDDSEDTKDLENALNNHSVRKRQAIIN